MFSYAVKEWCTNHECQVAMATKLCAVVTNICGLSVWRVLFVTLLGPRILRYLRRGLSGKYEAMLNISRTGFVALIELGSQS